jgi:DNA (cytosine-5)-methyltransferase 1
MGHHRDDQRAYHTVDLFCGAGGLTAGFRDEQFDVALALDNDEDASATYQFNFGDRAKVLTRPINELGDDEVRRLAGPVDVVLGGPSCASFSTHGRRSGWVLGDARSNLWSHMHRVVKALRPSAFCMENVPGMLYFAGGRLARGIFGAFEDLGYVVHKEILLVANYNVPQLRRRLFVVGVKKGLQFVFPAPPRLGGWRRDTLELWEQRRLLQNLGPHLTVGEAIHDLPESVFASDSEQGPYRSAPRRGSLAEYLRNGAEHLTEHVAGRLIENTAMLASHVPPGGNWRDIPPHRLPDRFRRMRRTDSTNLIGRLDLDRPAYTLTTQFNNVTTGCFLHPSQDRALSVREGARIQTFRDDFRFVGNRASKCRQIGNAVPPLMARALARSLRASLEGSPPPPPFIVGSIDRDGVPAASSLATARRMARQRRHDTAPEMAVRRELQSRGHRYRVQQPVPGHPRRKIDIAFTGKRVAILVHGCFWHGCPEHSRPTKSNSKWWADKIAANRKRDKVTRALLSGKGWTTVVVWEHEDPRDAVSRIEAVLGRAPVPDH